MIARRRRRGERNRRGDHAGVVEVVGEAAAAVAVQDGNHASSVGSHVGQAVVARKRKEESFEQRKALRLLRGGIQRLALRRTPNQRRNLSIDAHRRTRAQTGRETAVGTVSPPGQPHEESAEKNRRIPLRTQSKWFADTCFGRQRQHAGGRACLRRKNQRPCATETRP
jgi:hypothetical protein